MTPRQKKLVRIMYLNPRMKIIRDVVKTRSKSGLLRKEPRSLLDNEQIYSGLVDRLLKLGYLEKIFENEETEISHYSLSREGKKAAAVFDHEAPKRPKRKKPKVPKRRGRRSKAWHEKHDPRMVEMKRGGAPATSIAKELKISVHTVRRVLKKHGLVRNYDMRYIRHKQERGDW